MIPPLLFFEHGDLTAFRTIEDAELYLEPVDVLRNEYVAFDSSGFALTVKVARSKGSILWGLWKVSRSSVKIEVGSPNAQDNLRAALQQYLLRTGDRSASEVIGALSLEELIENAVSISGFSA